MPWLVSGSCNHCGKCCKRGYGVLGTGVCMPVTEDACLFYDETTEDNGEKFGHCLILGRNGNIKNVHDRNDVKITQEQIDWFEYNCPNFPQRIKDVKQLVAGKFELPSGCNYTLTWVD